MDIFSVTEVGMLSFSGAGAVVHGTASACHAQGLFLVLMRIGPPNDEDDIACHSDFASI